ncbi:hypothetical protein [Mesorhizobium sp. B2-3-4]|uniref:hypothetical protein n=1 Tax=Mesorhizobium sp. B2-3-4 TaxID=2589959 RepID=UPI00112AA04B|nr:hypothetical protein [Mesorhizobium sp. B2-3-4]TPM34208.1 hypothetical protein FJ967_22475 [Mesorhizobium sp. B2-3-4]
MWEALMLLRLIASASPRLSLGQGALSRRDGDAALPGRAGVAALPADTLKGAIRLNFAAWRLSLPLSQRSDGHENHDRKIA